MWQQKPPYLNQNFEHHSLYGSPPHANNNSNASIAMHLGGNIIKSDKQAHLNLNSNRGATLPFQMSNLMNSSTSHSSLYQPLHSTITTINHAHQNYNPHFQSDNELTSHSHASQNFKISNPKASKRTSQVRAQANDAKVLYNEEFAQVNGGGSGQVTAVVNYPNKKTKIRKYDKYGSNKENVYTGNVSRERSPMTQKSLEQKGKLTQRQSTDNRQTNTSIKKQQSQVAVKKSKNSRKSSNHHQNTLATLNTIQSSNFGGEQSQSTSNQNTIMQFNLKNESKKLVQKLKQTTKSKNFAHLSNFFLSSNTSSGQAFKQGKNTTNNIKDYQLVNTNNNSNNASQLNSNYNHQPHHHLLNSTTTIGPSGLQSSSSYQMPFYLAGSNMANHRSPDQPKLSSKSRIPAGYIQRVGGQSPQQPSQFIINYQNQSLMNTQNSKSLSRKLQNSGGTVHLNDFRLSNHSGITKNGQTAKTQQSNHSLIQQKNFNSNDTGNGRRSQGWESYERVTKANSKANRKSQIRDKNSGVSSYGFIGGPTSRGGSPTGIAGDDCSMNRDFEKKCNQAAASILLKKHRQSSQMKRGNNSTTRTAAKESLMKHLSAQQSRKRLLIASHYEGSPPLTHKPNRKQSSKKCESQSSTLRAKSSASKLNKKSAYELECSNKKNTTNDQNSKHQYGCTPLNQNGLKIQFVNSVNAGSPEYSKRTRQPGESGNELVSTNASIVSHQRNMLALQTSCLSVIKEKSRQSFGTMFKSQGSQAKERNTTSKERESQRVNGSGSGNGSDGILSGSKRVSTERSVNINKPPLSIFSSSPKLHRPKVPSYRPSQLKASSQIHSDNNSLNRNSGGNQQTLQTIQHKLTNQKSQTMRTDNLINFYNKVVASKAADKSSSKELKTILSKEQLNKLIKAMKNESMPKIILDIERTMSRDKDSRKNKQMNLRIQKAPCNNQDLNQDLKCHFSLQDTDQLSSENRATDNVFPFHQNCQDNSQIYKTFKNRDDMLEEAIFGDSSKNTTANQNQRKNSISLAPNTQRNSISMKLQENLRKISEEIRDQIGYGMDYQEKYYDQIFMKNQNAENISLRQNTNRQVSIASSENMMKPVFSEQIQDSTFNDGQFKNDLSIQSRVLQNKLQQEYQQLLEPLQQNLKLQAHQKNQRTIKRSKVFSIDQIPIISNKSINQRIFSIEDQICTTPKMRTMNVKSSPYTELKETPLNVSQISQNELQKIVQAKLHLHQFQKVFCKNNQNSLRPYPSFATGSKIITTNNQEEEKSYLNDEESKNISGITDFSLELEMLNKLHVEKNTFEDIRNLPILNEQLLPDLSCSLYQEQHEEGNLIKFTKDNRHKIQFKDPFRGKPKIKIDKKRLQQILYNNYNFLNDQSQIILQNQQSPFLNQNEGDQTDQLHQLINDQHWINQFEQINNAQGSFNNISESFAAQNQLIHLKRIQGYDAQEKYAFQKLQEISGIGLMSNQNHYYYGQMNTQNQPNLYQDGTPQIVDMDNQSQMQASNTYRQSLEQMPFNPFSTVLKCKKNQDLIFQGPRKNEILFIGPNNYSQSPSSCHTSPSSKPRYGNNSGGSSSGTNYQAQKILGRDSFDELESIKDDSNIYFGNAPAKKLPFHQRFQSTNSDLLSENNLNGADNGLGLFSRDYEKNSFQGVLMEEEEQQQQIMRTMQSRQKPQYQVNHQKNKSSLALQRQLFNSIQGPAGGVSTNESIYFDSFIIPDDPRLLEEALQLNLHRDLERVSVFRQLYFPILRNNDCGTFSLDQMNMQVYNAMRWFEQGDSVNHQQQNQPPLEYYDFDAALSPFDKTISPSSFESKNFPASPDLNQQSPSDLDQIAQSPQSPLQPIYRHPYCEINPYSERCFTNQKNQIFGYTNNNNYNNNAYLNSQRSQPSSISNQSSVNKYKRRQQPQQHHPDSRNQYYNNTNLQTRIQSLPYSPPIINGYMIKENDQIYQDQTQQIQMSISPGTKIQNFNQNLKGFSDSKALQQIINYNDQDEDDESSQLFEREERIRDLTNLRSTQKYQEYDVEVEEDSQDKINYSSDLDQQQIAILRRAKGSNTFETPNLLSESYSKY